MPGFAQIPDVAPTILGRLNLKPPARFTGEDLWPYVSGQRTNARDHVVMAYAWIASVRTQEWNYSAVWNPDQYRGQYQPQLYDVRKDPRELDTVAAEHPSVVKELHARIEEYISSGWPLSTNGSFHAPEGA